jgi:FkbM family methyltransferase
MQEDNEKLTFGDSLLQPLRKMLLSHLLRLNLQDGDIEGFENDETFPAIRLKDQTQLSAPRNPTLERFSAGPVPATHTAAALAYLTRYKFPHAMPHLRMLTGWIPRVRFPGTIHLQHKNTLHELPAELRDEFTEALALSEGDRVLEVGPFIGFGSLRMSPIVGEQGRVVSVEVDEKAYQCLSLNLEQNGIQNVKALNYAVGDTDDDEALVHKGGAQANSLVAGVIKEGRTVQTRCRKLETILSETDCDPDFMILTINGAEFSVLDASRDFLNRDRRLRIIAPGWYRDEIGLVGPRIVTLLTSMGFQVAHTSGWHIFAYR